MVPFGLPSWILDSDHTVSLIIFVTIIIFSVYVKLCVSYHSVSYIIGMVDEITWLYWHIITARCTLVQSAVLRLSLIHI